MADMGANFPVRTVLQSNYEKEMHIFIIHSIIFDNGTLYLILLGATYTFSLLAWIVDTLN